ncbi:DgyrCDS14925 [Dimorphilus gyrociliatus]|uniref:DgyrCDS14925 n=1 Tax=Dimorphilus gyrociliatus TaxID=2664684 RepID=A0A7I8WFC9_9ANNE|nr:DgyrCDS14925 [Dimorphilus gyrociliatus]
MNINQQAYFSKVRPWVFPNMFEKRSIDISPERNDEFVKQLTNQLNFIAGFISKQKKSYNEIVDLKAGLFFKDREMFTKEAEEECKKKYATFQQSLLDIYQQQCEMFLDLNNYDNLFIFKRYVNDRQLKKALSTIKKEYSSEENFNNFQEKVIEFFSEANSSASNSQEENKINKNIEETETEETDIHKTLDNLHCPEIIEKQNDKENTTEITNNDQSNQEATIEEYVEIEQEDHSNNEEIVTIVPIKHISNVRKEEIQKILQVTDHSRKFTNTQVLNRNYYNRDLKLSEMFSKIGFNFKTETEAKNHAKLLKPIKEINSDIMILGNSSFRDVNIKNLCSLKLLNDLENYSLTVVNISKLLAIDLEEIVGKWNLDFKILILHVNLNGVEVDSFLNLVNGKFTDSKKIICSIPYTNREHIPKPEEFTKLQQFGLKILDLTNLESLGYKENPTGKSKGKHLTKTAQEFCINLCLKCCSESLNGNQVENFSIYNFNSNKYIVNLSKYEIPRDVEEFLNLGLKFTFHQQSKSNWQKISTLNLEEFFKRLIFVDKHIEGESEPLVKDWRPKKQKSELTQSFSDIFLDDCIKDFKIDCKRYLKQFQFNNINNPKNNKNFKLNNQTLMESLKSFFSLDIIIKSSDKGSCLVIQNREDYLKMCQHLISDEEQYCLLTNGHVFTKQNIKYYKDLLKKYKYCIESSHLNALLDSLKDCKPRNFYALPKIHKEQQTDWIVPFSIPKGRPVISCLNSETYEISRFIHHLLYPISKLHPSFIENSTDILHHLQDLIIPNDALLITMDIKSMFSIIDTHSGLNAIEYFLEKYSPFGKDNQIFKEFIINTLKYSLHRNHFLFNGQFYLQKLGCAMGQSYAPAYANIWMAWIEETIIANFQPFPFLYKRYLDDIFIIWTDSKKEFDIFYAKINNIKKNLKFKVQIEKSKISFLDLTFFKGTKFLQTGKLDYSIHFKNCETFNLLNRNSLHPPYTFKGILKAQFQRFYINSSSPFLYNYTCELVKKSLQRQGYSHKEIKTAIKKVRRTNLKMTKVNSVIIPKDNQIFSTILKERILDISDKILIGDGNRVVRRRNTIDLNDQQHSVLFIIHCKECQKNMIAYLQPDFGKHITNILLMNLTKLNNDCLSENLLNHDHLYKNVRKNILLFPLEQIRDTSILLNHIQQLVYKENIKNIFYHPFGLAKFTVNPPFRKIPLILPYKKNLSPLITMP